MTPNSVVFSVLLFSVAKGITVVVRELQQQLYPLLQQVTPPPHSALVAMPMHQATTAGFS